MNAKIKYDYETDILSFTPAKRNYASSIQEKNFIFDLDRENKIAGFEMLQASVALDMPKIFLKNIKSLKGKIEVENETIKVNLSIKCIIRNSDKSGVYSLEKKKPEFMEPSQIDLAQA